MADEHVPIDEATYVVVDVETTGLDYRTEHIIEIGAVKMVGGIPVETFNQLVNPNRMIPPKITRLTAITNAMVCDAPDIKEALTRFSAFARGSALVAHNASFDISFLNKAARLTGIKQFRQRYFDTKLMAQKLNPLLGFYRLENLAEHFGAKHRPRHRALPDALATADVFSSLLEIMKARGLTTVGKASEFFYPRARYDFSAKKELAESLPCSSGVYLMRDKYGAVIYAGKAKDLRKRVKSYFYSGPKTDRQLSLLMEIHSVDHIETGTEIGALLLESKLIKKFKPAYNVLGKRYRRHPFVHIDFDDEFPTPKIVKKVTGKGFHYGPFSNTADLELLLEVMKDLYGLKQCDYKIKPGARKQPCFYYQVKRCSGPCSGMISPQGYLTRLFAVTEAFDGRPQSLREELISRRDKAADRLLFEKAALLNRALMSLERTVKLLEGIRNARVNLNFLLLEDLDTLTKVYLVEDGQLRSCLHVGDSKKDMARLKQKITRTYFGKKTAHDNRSGANRPGKNGSNEITPEQIENLSLLISYFQKKPVIRIKIGSSPQETLHAALAAIGVKQPAQSAEIKACLSLQPR